MKEKASQPELKLSAGKVAGVVLFRTVSFR